MGEEPDRSIDLTIAACAAYARPDLAERIERERGRRDAPPYVLVTGEFQQGKSSLVNAMTGTAVCPVPPGGSTSVATVVHVGTGSGPIAVRVDGSVEPIGAGDIAGLVTAEATEQAEHLDRVEVWLGAPRDVLVVVDAPGAGGWSSRLGARSIAWLPVCLAAVVCHDGGAPLTPGEVAVVGIATALCPSVAVAITRVDLHPSWRTVVGDARGSLDAAGLHHVPVLPVSARLAAEQDPIARERSGIAALQRWAVGATTPIGGSSRLVRLAIAAVVELEAALTAEHRELEAAVAGMEDIAPPPTARAWQTVLGDGIADLGAEIDETWRELVKQLTKEAEDRLGSVDPATAWEPYERWLRSAGVAAATGAFAQLQTGLARVGADVFREVGVSEELRVRSGDPDGDRFAGLQLELRLEAGAKLGSRTLLALRSSYSGMAMIGMLAGAAGLTVAGPALLVLGATMAGKGTLEERRKEREKRRQQALQAARRYLDELSRVVAQALREGLRLGQRDLRDACAGRAEALAAERRRRSEELRRSDAARRSRLDDVAAEIERVRKLRARLERSAGGGG